MKNNLFKKSLALVMTVMMLMTCWVFMPATHEHFEADAAFVNATEAYNKAMLEEINTNVDYNVNTSSNYYQFIIYGNGDNSTANTTARQQTYYRNILSHDADTSLVGDNNRGSYFSNVTNSELTVSIVYPTMVLKYDGQTNPKFGVMLEADASSGKKISFKRAWMDANTNGLSFNSPYWYGIAKDDSAFFYIMEEAKHKYLYAQDTSNGDQFSTRSNGQWEFLAAALEFTGSMSIGEWTRTISPTWKFDNGSTTYTGTNTSTIYVMNFKGYGELITRINNHKNELIANAAQYTPESVRTYVDAAKAITNLNPKNYTGINQASSWGSQMTTAYNNYNAAVNGLTRRQFEVTYDNMFSLADWRYSKSLGDANYVSVNLNEGKVTITNPNTSEFTTPMSGSSSSPNTRNTSFYSMPVIGGQEYTIKYTTDGSSTEMFAFFYDKNGGCTHQSNFGAYCFTVKNGTGQATFKAPDNSTQMEIRFDNNVNGTANFWDIMIYPATIKTELEVDSWTARPHRQIYAYNASVGTLQTPARYGYIFDGWMQDTDGDGVGDTAAPTGAITSTRVLYSTWTPVTMDVGYNNLFSLSKWANSNSSVASNTSRGSISYDLDSGTITAITTKDGEVYSNYGSASGHYQMTVKPNTEYIFVADVDLEGSGNQGQMFVFFYDASGAGVTGAIQNGNTLTSPHIGNYVSKEGLNYIAFTTPANCTKMSVRFGATVVPTTAVYSNIGFYEKADYDAFAKDFDYVRLPFRVGDTTPFFEPTREGYEFAGWELEDGTKISSVEGLTENTVVYATWIKKWTVTYYYADRTTPLATEQVIDGESVASLPSVNPTKDADADYYYDFDCWYANGAEFTADTIISADIKVYPEFSKTAHGNFIYSLYLPSTCTENAQVYKICGDDNCSYNFGIVTYNPAPGEEINTAWLAKGHDYSGGILANSSTGNTDSDTHSVKCVRYNTCGSAEKVNHSFEGNVSEGATCVIPGTIKKTCPCGAEKYVEGEVDSTNHVHTTTINVVSPDCENDGYTGDTYCEDCKKIISYGTTDGKLGHSFTKYESDGNATCTEDGTKTAKCDRCNETDTVADVGSALGHTWINEGTDLYEAADCENDAVYYQTCSVCGISAKDDTTNTGSTWALAGSATGHAYTGAIRNNNNGTHSYLCANGCNTYGYNKVKEASTGCTYGEWTKSEADTHTKTCTECTYAVTEKHTFTNWVTVDGATNTAAAEHTRECTVCGRTETTDCTYTSVETKVTCTTDGYTTHTCDICKHVYVTPGTTATGHDYTGAVQSLNNGTHNYLCKNGCGTYGYETVENAFADCDYKYENDAADGEHQATCKECGYSFAEKCSGGQATCTTAAVCEKCNVAYGTTVPHSFEGAVVVLEGDFHAYLCEFCGDTTGIKGVGSTVNAKEACAGGSATCTALAICEKCGDTHGELDADAHNWGAWTNVEGTETHVRVCGYNNAHTEEAECFSPDIVIVAPDCETAGYTINTCEICGHVWHTNPTAPLDHYWGKWVTNNDGTHTRTCMDETCKYGENGGAKTETASCTKENAEAVVTEPTCTEGGYTTYTCKDCGYVWKADATPATGHSYTEKTKKTDSKYQRSTKDCVTDWTYWYCCNDCDVSAETEVDKYDDITELYWVREAAVGHKYDAKTATEDYLATVATCTEKATYFYSCSVCGASSEGTDKEATFEHGSALNHDWQDTETYLKSEADCINNEVYYKECSRCHISSENETGATWEKADTKSGHDFEYTKGVAATCTESGIVEHYTCKICNKHFKADQTTEIAADKLTIAALKHDFKDVAAKAATCEEAGYTKHKQCQREDCGYRNNDYEVIPALGHEYKAENGYYTDKDNNKHAYYCTNNCGTYGIGNVKNETVDCVFDGEYVQYDDENGIHSHKKACVCGNEQSAACADAEPVHVLPTCTEDGYYIHTCDDCGFEWTVASDAEEDEALGHDTKVVPNNNGTHSIKCQRENCDYAEAAEKCSTATPATNCGEYDICDICKTAFGEAKPHVFTKYVYNNDAKCGVNGTETATCDTCKGETKATDTRTAKNTALEHVMVVFEDEDSLRYKTAGVWYYNNAFGYDLSEWAGKPADFDETIVARPTCKNDGRAISYCTREGCDHYTTKVAGKVDDGHIWGEEYEVGGNCATGVTFRTECTLCGKATTRVEVVEHTYVIRAIEAANCESAELIYKVCSVCGDDKEEYNEEHPALGHDWSIEVIEKEATCAQAGRKYDICSRCNAASAKTEIPKLGHAWEAEGFNYAEYIEENPNANILYVEASDATCRFEGHNGYYKCFNCSYDQHLDENWRKDNIIEIKAHEDNDADGKCDECNTKLYGEDGNKDCNCICHKENWFSKIIYKILCFFWRLFGIGKSCECGTVHY